MTIAILGGTGPQGKGLAMRFARAGIPVMLGSRNAERAEEIAAELNGLIPEGAAAISGGDNEAAVSAVAYSAG